jgi:mono/diheme cytochrome c family protein
MRHCRNYIALALLAVFAPFVRAKDDDFKKQVQPILQQYCYDCHGNGKHKGDLALDDYKTIESLRADRKKWELVLHNVKSGEMPPEKKPQPSQAQRDLIAKFVEDQVFPVDPKKPDPGRVTIRRLNRAEYNNTIRDLVGVEFHPADDFPVDDVGYGFDNIGDVLSMPPILLEKYLAAADKILDAAIIETGPILDGPRHRIEAEKLPTTADGSKPYGNFAFALNKEGEIYTTNHFETSGEYIIRTRAFGQQAGPEVPRLELRVDGKAIHVFDVHAVEEKLENYDYKLRVEAGDRRLAGAYINNYVRPDGDRNLLIDYFEVIGPVSIQPYPETHRRIFFRESAPAADKDKEAYAREIVARFAKRAFRRPVASDEVDRLMALYAMARKDGDSFERSVKVALSAVLISPHFLFRGEIQPDPDNPRAVHPINEFALASRLSYFLWSTMPDDRLFELAGKKVLRKNLESEVARMLKDPRSRALVENFADQWLQIRNLASVNPDPKLYPGWNNELRDAMRKETEMFFENLMRENRSVVELIDANYSFLNERLARHYGVEGVAGPEFQKVNFKDNKRGGVLTQGSVLTITSNPTRTSPVKRGKWVLENIVGAPPPPPPPNVPELKEAHEAKGSLRQRMELHRENAMCASCHARMDPIGFGFENYDGVGKWRDQDGDYPVDAAGKLLSGEDFRDAGELKKILVGPKREEFLRCLASKLLTFALGRGMEYYDRPSVDGIVKNLAKDQYRFSALVNGVVKSPAFQLRRGEGD